jgi:hypothetical protein
MRRHRWRPNVIREDYCRIGEPPLSDKTGQPILDSYRYQNNWIQGGQIFSYQNGLDDTQGDDIDTSGNGTYYIILPSSTAADTSETDRFLEGALIPWFCEPTVAAGAFTQLVTVTWQQTGGTAQTLYESAETIESGNPLNKAGFLLKSRRGTNQSFKYTPHASEGWTWGKIVTKGIRTAALGVWMQPYRTLTAAQAVVEDPRVAAGEVIRGQDSSIYVQDKRSLGDIMTRTGIDDGDYDAMLQNATQCVWQWGHSHGAYTETNSYQTMGSSGTEYKLLVPDLYPDTTIGVYPTAYVTRSGCSGGDPGYLKLTAEDLGGGADTWTLTFTDDGTELFTYTDASSDTLLCRVGTPTKFKVELMAPSSGYVVLHTLALWSRLWETP